MITVVERWFLRAEFADEGVRIMQEMDDLVGPAAHEHPGWSGHARFFRTHDSGTEYLMMYDWQSIESHQQLREREDGALAPFYQRYCMQPRTVSYYEAIEVDVEGHHHDH